MRSFKCGTSFNDPNEQASPLMEKETQSDLDLEGKPKIHTDKRHYDDNDNAQLVAHRKRTQIKLFAALFTLFLIASAMMSTVMPACSMSMRHHTTTASTQALTNLLDNEEPIDEPRSLSKRSFVEAQPMLAKRESSVPPPVQRRNARRNLSPEEAEANKKKLEKAQKEIEQIKKEEENKKDEATQKRLTILEREISVQDQQKYVEDLGLWGADEVVEPSGQKIMILTATDGNGANAMIKNVLEMAESNRREYCDYHNYVYKFINMSRFDLKQVHPVWGKLNALKAAFEEHPNVEWIWWLDVDVIIMNPEIDLARHVLNPKALTERLSYGRPLKHPSFGQYSSIRSGYRRDTPLPITAAKSVLSGIEAEDYEYTDVNKIDIVICQDYWGLNAGSFFIRRSDFIDQLIDYWADPVFIEKEFTFREQDTLGHLNINHRTIRERIGIVPQRMLNSYISDDLWSGYDDGDLTIHFAGCWIPGDCDDRWQRHWKKRGRVPEKYRNSHGSDIQ